MPSTSHVTSEFSDSSRSVKDSRFQHGKACTTKHHALDHFEPVHIPLDLPAAPVIDHRGSDCRFILHQANGKTLQFLQSALLSSEPPLLDPVRLLAYQELLKLPHKFQTGTDFRTQSLKLTNILLLIWFQLFRLQQPPHGLARCRRIEIPQAFQPLITNRQLVFPRTHQPAHRRATTSIALSFDLPIE